MSTFIMDVPHQVAYIDDDDTVDIPAYTRGKEIVARSLVRSVKPNHFRLEAWVNNTPHHRRHYRQHRCEGRKPKFVK